LVKLGEFRKIRNVRRTEWIWAVVAFFGVIILGTLQGILVAVILSILALLYLASNPPVYRVGRKVGTDVFRPLKDHPGDETFPGLLMLRTEGVMFFASAPHAIDQIALMAREHQPKIIVLDCSPVPNFEYTSIKQFSDFDDKLHTSGVTLWLAALNREAFETIEKTELGKALGHERMFLNLEQAVEAYQKLLNTHNNE
ncbi:MAG: STAS domain-containing protein, partial [Anaerolineales bacterium]|nr:STAS domain-containing protein [Anaerolineales bacterium]